MNDVDFRGKQFSKHLALVHRKWNFFTRKAEKNREISSLFVCGFKTLLVCGGSIQKGRDV